MSYPPKNIMIQQACEDVKRLKFGNILTTKLSNFLGSLGACDCDGLSNEQLDDLMRAIRQAANAADWWQERKEKAASLKL